MIIIEGNIGSGKTTISRIMSDHFKARVLEELINEKTTKLLNKFYLDKKKWSFALQVHFLNERYKQIKSSSKLMEAVSDRSIYGDAIFAKVLHNDGDMTLEEYEIYISLLNNMIEDLEPPKLMIYLDTDIDICIERIKNRNRGNESTTISKDYLSKLSKEYIDWYSKYNASRKVFINYNDFSLDNGKDLDSLLNMIGLMLNV